MEQQKRHIPYLLSITTLLVLIQLNAYPQPSGSKKMRGIEKMHHVNLLDSAITQAPREPQKAFGYIESALEYSINNKDKAVEAKSYNTLGIVNSTLKQYDLSITYFKKTIALAKYISPEDLNIAYYNLAKSYEMLDQYDLSLEYYNKSLNQYKSYKQPDSVVVVRHDIARIYTLKKEYSKALADYEDILKMEEQTGNIPQQSTTNALMGDVYLNTQRNKEATENYSKAVQFADQSQDKDLQIKSRRKLSKALRANQEYEKELTVRQEALSFGQSNDETDVVAEENLEIGKVYIQQNKPEQAVGYLQNSIKLSEQIGDKQKKGAALQTLSTAFKNQGAYDKALLAYQEYAAITDALYTERENKLKKDLDVIAKVNRKLQRIELLERDFEINRKTLVNLQREQELSKRELSTQRKISYALVFVLLAISGASFFVYKSSLQRRRANLLLALKSLRSQMNPHFIFNSLNSVNSYIAQNNERMANKYLSDFSQLMRSVMENSKYEFVAITSEIDIIGLYLKLEHSRFRDKFDYTFEIDEGIKNSEIEIPPMLIQPYIENAVWHGLRYKEEKGVLEVTMRKKDDNIFVQIADDGIGRKRSVELKTTNQKRNSSTGLKNTKSRLDIINEIYKTKFAITIRDKIPESQSGTVVEIYIPYAIKNED